MKERHLQILNIINEKEKVSVQELSEALKLSMVTIRKDLEDLEEQGLLRRQHGYAAKASPDSINSRMAIHYPEKKAIAQKAVELITPMETIMIESGSTCALFALEAARQKDEKTLISMRTTRKSYVRARDGARIFFVFSGKNKREEML